MSVRRVKDSATEPSFTFQNRMYRGVWGLVECSLFRFSPRPFHAWRRFLLRSFGAKIGRHVHIHPTVSIWSPQNLVIADLVGIGDKVEIYNMGQVVIGERAVVSQKSYLCGGSHDFTNDSFQLYTGDIVIGARAWICGDVFVLPGVEIAEGVVVGARSLVGKDLSERDYIYAGNPAKGVRPRYANDKDQLSANGV